MNRKKQFFISTNAYIISLLMFICIAIIIFAHDFIDPVESVLVKMDDPPNYRLSDISVIMSADIILVVCWIIGWFGTGKLLHVRSLRYAKVIFLLGFYAALLDFIETGLSWSLIAYTFNKQSISHLWVYIWQILNRMSYVLAYFSAGLYGITLKPNSRFETGLRIFLVFGTVFALLGLYIKSIFDYTFVWWPAFFILLAIQLIFENSGRSALRPRIIKRKG